MSLSNIRVAPANGNCQRNRGLGHSTGIGSLDASDQRHISRAFMSILPIVNRCRSEQVSAEDTL